MCSPKNSRSRRRAHAASRACRPPSRRGGASCPRRGRRRRHRRSRRRGSSRPGRLLHGAASRASQHSCLHCGRGLAACRRLGAHHRRRRSNSFRLVRSRRHCRSSTRTAMPDAGPPRRGTVPAQGNSTWSHSKVGSRPSAYAVATHSSIFAVMAIASATSSPALVSL